MGISERIAEIELEMSRTQKNKATEHHLGGLKAKLAKLKAEMATGPKQSAPIEGWEVQKSGDARVCLLGFPSVGKSTFLSEVTTTFSKQAEHEFTTIDCVSGKMKYKGSSIQILDLPGIIDGASSNKGRGRQIISVAKTADLIVMMLDNKDISRDDNEDKIKKSHKSIITNELNKMGIKLNKRPPNVTITPGGNGIEISSTIKLTKLTDSTINGILKAYKMHNCQISIKEDITDEDLIDVIGGNSVYIPCVYVYNKIDEMSYEEFLELSKNEENLLISCNKKWNIEDLKEEIYKRLNFTRIYTKKKGEDPNLEEPIILRGESTIKEVCNSIHKDFYSNFKHAFVWGRSTKHSPQKVGLSHVLLDEDVVQLHTSK